MERKSCNKITAASFLYLALSFVGPSDKTVQLGSWIYEVFFTSR